MPRAKHTHDALATIGTYKDRQTGEEKKSRIKVGRAFTSDTGNISIKLDAVPVGSEWSGWISLYPARERPDHSETDAPPAGRRASPGMPMQPAARVDDPADDSDDLPF